MNSYFLSGREKRGGCSEGLFEIEQLKLKKKNGEKIKIVISRIMVNLYFPWEERRVD